MIARLKRWWWVALAIVVVVGLWRVRIDVEMLNLLPQDEPSVQGLKLYQQYFANARELIISLRAPEAETAERLAGELAVSLRQQTNLVAGVSWQPPWMEQPLQAAEFIGWLWLNQPPKVLGALAERLAPDHLDAVLAETKETLTTSMSPLDIARRAFDPYDILNIPALTNFSGFSADQGQRMFASSDGTFRVLFVQARSNLTSYPECAAWLEAIQKVVTQQDRAGTWDKVAVRYTGRPAFVTEIAASMQRDLRGSLLGTAVIIALLFWLTHRRWLPMLWLLVLLALILVVTVAIGGLLLGPLSVISLGFAAVLLGLAVDYAVVHYQEALAHPAMTVPEIRRAIAPSILWAAITTISAFLVLNLGGLPGLAQLGSLVALGVSLSAMVMVVAFLPPLFPERRRPAQGQIGYPWWSYLIPKVENRSETMAPVCRSSIRRAFWITAIAVCVALTVLGIRRPGLDRSANALRLQHDEAQSALEEVTAAMGIPQDSTWIVVPGRDESEVYDRLMQAQVLLDQAVSNRVVREYLMPAALWPRPAYQTANRETARRLGTLGPTFRAAALRQGFRTNALDLTEAVVQTWARTGSSSGVVWPTNDMSQWLLKRFVARGANEWLMMGAVYPCANRADTTAWRDLSTQLAGKHVLLSGWELLGANTLRRVQSRLWMLVLPMVLLVVTSLWLAFRRVREIVLGLVVLMLSGLCLLAVMVLAGWSWNLLNLMALPLILGTGVDYGIFIQLSLRRHRGDLELVRRSVGRALMLCGGTAIAGFGSLAWSGNAGMASLGRVCAVGIAGNMLISVWLLPAWWRWTSERVTAKPGSVARPSVFYRAWLWRLGMTLVRWLPAGLVRSLCAVGADLHFLTQRARREVVVQNLLPACAGNRIEAEHTARRLYRNFGWKLADLWRLESGAPAMKWLTAPGDQEVIRTALARGSGVLLLTLHLGNWEHGGLLLADLGIKLTVLTRAEPQDRLTHLRRASRARCGIGTLVIGEDHFAFVEVIKRLQAGAALAVAIDRPPESATVEVDLFGHPFRASMAAAELARASGCALVGVTVVRQPEGYAARVLSEFVYDRQALGQREARHALTQQIMRAFEPEIRNHLDQWYHFVPVWVNAG